MSRHPFIKNWEELYSDKSFSYPGDTETFGTGARLAREMGLKKIAVNYEILKPGDRSCWPHAHSVEEEFTIILSGQGQYWINGEVYDVKAGDCIAFPPGEGSAHCFINNSDENLVAIVVGEQNPEGDKVYYPKHPKRNEEIKGRGFYWEGHPEPEMGPHDGWPDKKRP